MAADQVRNLKETLKHTNSILNIMSNYKTLLFSLMNVNGKNNNNY